MRARTLGDGPHSGKKNATPKHLVGMCMHLLDPLNEFIVRKVSSFNDITYDNLNDFRREGMHQPQAVHVR